MTIVTGKVVNGRIEVQDVELVTVYYSGGEPEIHLTPEQLAELDEAIAEADRGELIPAEDVLRELRARTNELVSRRR